MVVVPAGNGIGADEIGIVRGHLVVVVFYRNDADSPMNS